jgi:hypothetical protein
MKFTKLFAGIAIAIALTACGKAEVSSDRLEEARQTAKTNSEFNARLYKAANPRFTSDFSIVGRSDTSQNAECPQGDGWASLSIMKVEGKVVDKTALRCSTYSASVGCFREEDFAKDPQLVKEDGHCRAEVPYPLPVLVK